MKYSLSINLNAKYLQQADEIKLLYKDREAIYDCLKKYPQASYYIKCDYDNIDWDDLRQYYFLTKENMLISVSNYENFVKAKEYNFKVCFSQEVYSYFQLNALIKLNVDAIYLGAPLFLDLDNVIKITKEIPIRAVPNLAYRDFLPRDTGISGTWIRPEDMIYYEPYISMCEFENCDVHKEEALFRIYALEHNWPGPLDLIIDNLNSNSTNRMISSDFTSKRTTCGQRCEMGRCKICYRMFELANEELILDYKNNLEKSASN